MGKDNSTYGNTKGDFYNQSKNAGMTPSQTNNAWHNSDTKIDAVHNRDFGSSSNDSHSLNHGDYVDYSFGEDDY